MTLNKDLALRAVERAFEAYGHPDLPGHLSVRAHRSGRITVEFSEDHHSGRGHRETWMYDPQSDTASQAHRVYPA